MRSQVLTTEVRSVSQKLLKFTRSYSSVNVQLVRRQLDLYGAPVRLNVCMHFHRGVRGSNGGYF